MSIENLKLGGMKSAMDSGAAGNAGVEPELKSESAVNVNTRNQVSSVDDLTGREPSIVAKPSNHRRLQGRHVTPQNCDSIQLTISLFENEKDKVPLGKQVTWGELKATHFRKHWINKTKRGGRTWAPVSYKAGATRGNQGVEMVCCAVFDIEHHGGFDQIREKIAGYAYIAHSSYGHTPEEPRYRLVFPLANPIPASDWALAWEKLNHWLGGINDKATKDLARVYYLPCRPKDATEHFIEPGIGQAVNVAELPDPPIQSKQKVRGAQGAQVSLRRINDIEVVQNFSRHPAEGLETVVARCKFMADASKAEKQNGLNRRVWMAMVSNACHFEDSDEWIHEASCHHDSYDVRETDRLIQDCRERFHGPITCKKIQDYGYQGCPEGGCKTASGKVTGAPAGLWTRRDGSGEVAHGNDTPQRMGAMPPLVTSFVRGNFPNGLLYIKEEFLGYEGGYWKRLDLRADVRHKVAIHLGADASPFAINSLTALLQDFYATQEDCMKVPGAENLICMRNGTLDTSTYELKPHSPDHGLTYKLDIDWNPDAESPRWMQFLGEIFVNDPDKAKKIQFLQEWFGYCMTTDTSQHKFVWMVGSGGNGKSVLLNVLTGLIGPANVSHAQLERLDRPAVRAELDGKLVNISSEMSAEATVADGYLKAIVSGDLIEAERKFKPSFSFRPIVKLVGATNSLPRLLDLSDGFFRRAVIITFNRRFSEAEQDRGLESQLNAEMAGIFAWGVAGLRRLRERGSFIIPSSSIEALIEYREESDTVGLFAEECVEATGEGGMSSHDLFEAYSNWCRHFGFKPKNGVGFGKRLGQLGYENFRMASGNGWRVRERPSNNFLNVFGTAEVAVEIRSSPVEAGDKSRS